MATKLELMAEKERFDRIGETARLATTRFDFRNAVNIAVGCLPHLIGKLQYEKRFGQNPLPALIALDVIFHFAPPNFHFQALDSVERSLDEDKRIEKATDHDLRDSLVMAKATMNLALLLWAQVEHGLTTSSNLDAVQRGILADWQHGGLVSVTIRDSVPKYSLTLDLNAAWVGKCESCGAKVRGAKVQFLNVRRCPGCRGLGRFVLIDPVNS